MGLPAGGIATGQTAFFWAKWPVCPVNGSALMAVGNRWVHIGLSSAPEIIGGFRYRPYPAFLLGKSTQGKGGSLFNSEGPKSQGRVPVVSGAWSYLSYVPHVWAHQQGKSARCTGGRHSGSHMQPAVSKLGHANRAESQAIAMAFKFVPHRFVPNRSDFNGTSASPPITSAYLVLALIEAWRTTTSMGV